MIVFVNILERLADSGWTSYQLRKHHVLPEGTLTRLRNGQSITLSTVDKICELCGCQPGDILRYEPGKGEG